MLKNELDQLYFIVYWLAHISSYTVLVNDLDSNNIFESCAATVVKEESKERLWWWPRTNCTVNAAAAVDLDAGMAASTATTSWNIAIQYGSEHRHNQLQHSNTVISLAARALWHSLHCRSLRYSATCVIVWVIPEKGRRRLGRWRLRWEERFGNCGKYYCMLHILFVYYGNGISDERRKEKIYDQHLRLPHHGLQGYRGEQHQHVTSMALLPRKRKDRDRSSSKAPLEPGVARLLSLLQDSPDCMWTCLFFTDVSWST